MEIFKLGQFRKEFINSNIYTIYQSLLLGQKDGISSTEKETLLKIAIVFYNYGDKHLKELGYRLVVSYANLFKDYIPLYDIAINQGLIPIAKYIEEHFFSPEYVEEHFFNLLQSSYKECFRKDDIYLSLGQKQMLDFFCNNIQNNIVLVAPTSYGKSEIIIKSVIQNANKKVCIVVPSKALLAQTKKRLLKNLEVVQKIRRVITHPDMYRGNEGCFVAVLTQERLLRLLQKNSLLSLDFLLIDEAHNLLKAGNRSILLSQVILILKKRNPGLFLNFFTPFISNTSNLIIPYTNYDVVERKAKEMIKVEKYYICDLNGNRYLKLYDQYTNSYFNVKHFSQGTNDFDLLNQNKGSKNIVYLNRPRDIENVALNLKNSKQINQQILELTQSISDYLHPEYNILKCIKNGVVYHHGGMPDIIRLYVENLFSTIDSVNFIITNSTLLEGVNIPAEKIFILNTMIGRGDLNKSEFKNLVGRVCRFSEIFNKTRGNLQLLEPEIYILKGWFANKRSNIETFLSTRVKCDIKIEDDVENLLLVGDPLKLKSDDYQKLKDSLEYLENIEPNTVKVNNVEYAHTEIGRLCYKNNVYDFDIKKYEDVIEQNLLSYSTSRVIDSENLLMDAIYSIFMVNVEITDSQILRLKNESARRYYSMVLSWRANGNSYNEIIIKTVKYWSKLNDPTIYVGSRWGEIARENSRHKLYIDISCKSFSEKINLAIVRIKEEQDFVDNCLIKYVEILNDLELLDVDFYEKIKYGSSDPTVISLLKNGFSIELAKCITQNVYLPYISIDLEKDEVTISERILKEMEDHGENKILSFEISYHIH